MYDWEDYYDEPSEFDMMVEEFKESLKKSVKEDTQKLIEKLRKENEELRNVRDNWDQVKREYETKQRELQNEIYNCKQNTARMRLEQLFEACGMNVILYQPSSSIVYGTKCDKCDDDRYIHFKSPSGKDCKEECECAERYYKYKPSESHLCEFRVNRNGSDRKNMPLLMWFQKYRESNDFDGYTSGSSSLCKFVYNGEDFETIKKQYSVYDVYFRDEETCQKYCDYLNFSNGVTEDMVEHRRPVAAMKK